MRIRFAPALLASVLILAATPVQADDWSTPVGKDAARSGLSTETGPEDPTILWQGSRTSLIAQQGCAAGNLLVVNRIHSFANPGGTWLVAHDLTTGDELWAVQLPWDAQAPGHREKVTGIRDGHVYATRAGDTRLDYLYALDPGDGSIIWRSAEKIDESTTESTAYAADGDLIVGNFNSLRRIERNDGTTVWSTPRTSPTTDGSSAAVFGDRAYIWEASVTGPKVSAFDLATGQRLYQSLGYGGLVQQLGLFVGPDGTVYAPRSQNNVTTDYLIALADNGSALVEKWRVPLGYVPFASFAIGPDGSVYSYTSSNEIVRLDPATGDTLAISTPFVADFPMQPRMAADAAGHIYFTNGGFGQGRFYCYDADLTPRFFQDVPNVNLGGPVIGPGGILVVCGVGTDVRAYRTATTGLAAAPGAPLRFTLGQNVPNPFNPATEIGFSLERPAIVTLEVLDTQGRHVTTLIDSESRAAGPHAVPWGGQDGRGEPVSSGVYFYRLDAGGESATRKMLLVK
jgi:outer membrane protein assembly factor BamB